MLIVLSPAKTLDYETPPVIHKATQPEFLQRSSQLVDTARKLGPKGIRKLMGVSEQLAQLNHERFVNWEQPFTEDNARQAVLAFRGDVYSGLDADTMSPADFDFAQQHLRVLSGLYGLLRPLDLMQPYRLEMGLKFENSGGKNLYEFWGDEITGKLNGQLQALGSRTLVNLASNEYFKAVKPRALNGEVITPVFKDLKNGSYRVISFFAKKARGQMARHIIDQRLEGAEGLKDFRGGGYCYQPEQSTANRLIFTRDSS